MLPSTSFTITGYIVFFWGGHIVLRRFMHISDKSAAATILTVSHIYIIIHILCSLRYVQPCNRLKQYTAKDVLSHLSTTNQGCKHSAHCTTSIFPGKTTFERSRISCACIIGSSIQNLCENTVSIWPPLLSNNINNTDSTQSTWTCNSFSHCTRFTLGSLRMRRMLEWNCPLEKYPGYHLNSWRESVPPPLDRSCELCFNHQSSSIYAYLWMILWAWSQLSASETTFIW